jgi:hypothetical protein
MKTNTGRDVFKDTGEAEIVVSDNCSTENLVEF